MIETALPTLIYKENYMKKETRTKLICRKEMSNGKLDMFEVIVLNSDKAEKKKYFEDMGYDVSVK